MSFARFIKNYIYCFSSLWEFCILETFLKMFMTNHVKFSLVLFTLLRKQFSFIFVISPSFLKVWTILWTIMECPYLTYNVLLVLTKAQQRHATLLSPQKVILLHFSVVQVLRTTTDLISNTVRLVLLILYKVLVDWYQHIMTWFHLSLSFLFLIFWWHFLDEQ